MGARVLWPPECPDDVLSSAISKTQEIIGAKEINKDGEKVNIIEFYYLKYFLL